MLQELDDHTKKDLAAVLVPKVVLPGHNLCEVGDPADCLWILQSGKHIPLLNCPTPHMNMVLAPELLLPERWLCQVGGDSTCSL